MEKPSVYYALCLTSGFFIKQKKEKREWVDKMHTKESGLCKISLKPATCNSGVKVDASLVALAFSFNLSFSDLKLHVGVYARVIAKVSLLKKRKFVHILFPYKNSNY